MTIETLYVNRFQGISRTRPLVTLPGGGGDPGDTTPDPLLILSWNQLSGPFTDPVFGNDAEVFGSPERGVNEGGSGITTGSSRDVAFSGNGSDFAVTPHISQYEEPRFGIICNIQPDTLPPVGEKRIFFAKYTAGQGGRLTAELYNDDGTVRIRIGHGDAGFIQSDTGVGAVAAGVATRIGYTYDGTTGRIFQDNQGVIGAEAFAGGGFDNNTADWTWGQFPGGLVPYDGIFGDTSFYDFDFDRTFFEATDDAVSIAHGGGSPDPGGGEFTLAPATNASKEGLTHDGDDTAIALDDAADDAVYSLVNTLRVVDLTNPPGDLTWDGSRCLVHIQNRRLTGGGMYGGAAICRNMDPDYNWNPLYQSSNVPRQGVLIRNISSGSGNFTIEGLRLHGLGWDGIGFGAGTRNTLSNVPILRPIMTMQRDDCYENDNWVNGITISHSLTEGFVFISCRNSGFDGSSRTMFVNGGLHKCLPCRLDGNPGVLAVAFKLNSNSVRFVLDDFIIAIPDGTPQKANGPLHDLDQYGKLDPTSTGIIAWLGSGGYPWVNPNPNVFTVVTGSQAEDMVAAREEALWNGFPGHRFNIPGVIVDPAAP